MRAALVFALTVAACGQSQNTQGSSAAPSGATPNGSGAVASVSASAAPEKGPPWMGITQRTEEQVNAVLNGKNRPVYSGKTATLRGTIKITGDEPPATSLDIPAGCAKAAEMYGKLFRKGPAGELGDALVAVTEYDAFVPAPSRVVDVTVDGCAFSTRTLAVAYGQRIELKNVDAKTSFMPYLDGAAFRSVSVALPGGHPVKLYPTEPRARYLLRDMMKNPFMLAEVLVLGYATTDVTGADGKYEIRGIPVGKVRVDAYLPLIDKANGQAIELKEGDNELDLTLAYDQAKDVPANVPDPVWGDRAAPGGAPGGSSSGTAAPGPSPAPTASAR